MKKNGFTETVTKVIFYPIFLILLIILVLQNDSWEKRFIEQRKEAEKLKQNINRLSKIVIGIGEKIESGTIGVKASHSGDHKDLRAKWLAPNEPNFLNGDAPVSAPKQANFEGQFHKVYGLQGVDPKGMNFVLENSAPLREDIQEYVGMPLAQRSPSDPSKFYGKLAHRVEVTDDYKLYTIYIKPGYLWHRPQVDDSNPRYKWLQKDHYVTADDFVYTLDLILNPQVGAAHSRNYYMDIEWYKAIDEHTLQIRWKVKTYQSVGSTLELYPTPRWLYAFDEDGIEFPQNTAGLRFNEHWYNNRAIGCGPYEFLRWDQGKIIQLKRFEDFKGDLPPIKRINYHLIRDKNQQLLNFHSKTLDIHGLPVSQYREHVVDSLPETPYKNGTYDVHTITRMVYRYIGWNMDDYRFSDKRVRRAMTHAFDRPFVISNVLNGLGTLTTGNFYRHSRAYDETIEPYQFNLEEAARLLEEAGWSDSDGDGIRDKVIGGQKKNFEFPMIIYGYRPEVRSWSTLFKENLYKIGVKCSLVPVEWSVMLKRMEDREFVAYTGGWGLDFDGDPYQIFHSSQADEPKSSNRVGFRNKSADAIIEKLRNTFDGEERIKLQHAFHKIMHEEQPYTFLYSEKVVVATQPRLKNVNFQVIRPHIQTLNWYVE